MTDFHDDDRVAVLCNDVELEPSESQIDGEDREPLALEIRRHRGFGRAA